MKKNKKNTLIVLVSILAVSMLTNCRRDEDENFIQALPCTSIDVPTVWEDRGEGIDYSCDCVIKVNSKLTVEPGVVIQFANNAGIEVESAGSLQAVGSADNLVEFIGDIDVTGVWRGIFFRSNNVLNELNFCKITNAGSASFDGNATNKAAIRVRTLGQLKLRNSVISKNKAHGILVDGLETTSENPITSFANNQFLDNDGYPLSVIGSTITALDANSIFERNTNNKILIRGGRLYGDHTWKKQSIPYLIQDIVSAGYYGDNGNLTILPGVTIQFAGNAGLCSGDYSTGSWLKIEGTASERITLTGETPQPGAWKGVAFQSLSPNNKISYADISYGGSTGYTGANQRANILVGQWSAGALSIDNITVSNSAYYGIFVSFQSNDITVPTSVTYNGNAQLNYYKEP
jgi:hypothetical protein